MDSLSTRSYGKINLSLDILRTLPNGYHDMVMVMQQINLHDRVKVSFEQSQDREIIVRTNKPYIPTDVRNVAYKGGEYLLDTLGIKKGRLEINIKKTIPVGAGLAGGSSNAAAVLLSLNHITKAKLSLKELCQIGEKIGADVPFCICGQAYKEGIFGFAKDEMAMACAMATGTGVNLKKIEPLDSLVVLSKPPISVSTKEAYKGFDEMENRQEIEHPNTERLIEGIKEKNIDKVKNNMGNVLELYTLKMYYKAMYTKNKMCEYSRDNAVMMSGSGPTIYSLIPNYEQAKYVYKRMKEVNKETFLTGTII